MGKTLGELLAGKVWIKQKKKKIVVTFILFGESSNIFSHYLLLNKMHVVGLTK